MSNIVPQPDFPDADALARSLFEEGIRHLEDAHALHMANRYPAAIASAMKAAELGVKSIIVLGGAMGWWERVFLTHTPLTEMNNSPLFRNHILKLASYKATLGAEVMLMESLAPAKPGGSYEIEKQQNPEYPFLSYHQASGTDPGGFRLNKPSTHFGEGNSKRYYNTAQDLLTAVATQYAVIGGWGLAIPQQM